MFKEDHSQFVKWEKEVGGISQKLLDRVTGALREGMEGTQKTSREKYLSGPRPEKLGEITGKLKKSVKIRIQKKKDSVTGAIASIHPAAIVWEQGIRWSKKGFLRKPFLGPAVKDEETNIQKLLVRAGVKAFGN